MTKERRLSIEMWEDIKRQIIEELDDEEDDTVCVEYIKQEFLKDHNLKYTNDCYFCQYVKSCRSCPLNNGLTKCNPGSPYWDVTNPNISKDRRVKAADVIIDVLKGKYNRLHVKADYYFVNRIDREYIHIYDTYYSALGLVTEKYEKVKSIRQVWEKRQFDVIIMREPDLMEVKI